MEPPAEALVATPEETLLANLEWYRNGGEVSERQWAKELKVSDLLERALLDAGR